MIKVISKVDCPRCVNIKTYLKERNVSFEEEFAEDKGYEYWRNELSGKTGQLGFPILMRNHEEWVNGGSEQIIKKIEEWERPVAVESTKNPEYFWGI